MKLHLWKGIFFENLSQIFRPAQKQPSMEFEGKLHAVYLYGFDLLVNSNGAQVHKKKISTRKILQVFYYIFHWSCNWINRLLSENYNVGH